MPPIDAPEIFSQYHVYFFTGSHFAQNLKMAPLLLLLNLERLDIASGHRPNLGLPIAKESLTFIPKNKSYKCLKNFTF